MSKKTAFTALGQYLHQDIDMDASNLAELSASVVRMMTAHERDDLSAYLSTALKSYSSSELKGQLNRANENWNFGSKDAARFLRTLAEQLATGR